MEWEDKWHRINGYRHMGIGSEFEIDLPWGKLQIAHQVGAKV